MRKLWHRVRFKRDHRWAPGHMSEYLDDELGSSWRRRMQRHVKECPECYRLLTMLRRMVGALHRLPPSVGDADALRIAASVRRRLGERPP
jgi:anti-sigma factor RsiW